MWPYFERAAPNHVAGHVEDYREPDVSDPAMAVQQPRNKTRSDAHQNDGQPEPEDHRDPMVARCAGHRQHVVKRHGDVRNNDLPCSLSEGLPGDVALLPSQCSIGFLPIRAAQVAPHLPAHPKQQYSACQQQTDNLQQLQGDPGENKSQNRGSDNADENRARTLFRWQARCGKADHDRIVAGEDEIDHDHLEKRGECALRKKVELSHPLRSWVACPMNSRTDSISRGLTVAHRRWRTRPSSPGLQPMEMFRNTDGLWPREDGDSVSDIVEKILNGAFGP